MWAVNKTLFPADFPLLRCFDSVHAQGPASFGDGGEGVRRRVHCRPHQRDDRSFRTLAQSNYSLVRDSPCSVLSI
jgi:hypothetical protein